MDPTTVSETAAMLNAKYTLSGHLLHILGNTFKSCSIHFNFPSSKQN